MSKFLVCDGEIVPAVASGRPLTPEVLTCDVPWTVKSEPVFDISELFSQLSMLNSFDPDQAVKTIGFCLLIFTIGFCFGVVVKMMRRL